MGSGQHQVRRDYHAGAATLLTIGGGDADQHHRRIGRAALGRGRARPAGQERGGGGEEDGGEPGHGREGTTGGGAAYGTYTSCIGLPVLLYGLSEPVTAFQPQAPPAVRFTVRFAVP